MCVSRFKDRRRHSTQSCNATPHVVGRALCSTRCWYLYQVDQARNSRILVIGLVQMVVVVVIVVGNTKQFN